MACVAMSIFSEPDQRLKRPSTFASLEEIVEATERYAARVFEDEETAHRFTLAVSEAVTNAIEHGNARDASKQVVAELGASAGRVEARVTDQGEGFDPSLVRNALDDAPLLRTHGRGLHIIHEAADAVHYGAGGQRVRMVFWRGDDGRET
ncbi:MAG: ATP-binding protein [Bacteroidetes bacterium QS_9_68_14]|nr:MAG: ATP-binding protein [Bacteroidetes bacterium QS_9_68_14]